MAVLLHVDHADDAAVDLCNHHKVMRGLVEYQESGRPQEVADSLMCEVSTHELIKTAFDQCKDILFFTRSDHAACKGLCHIPMRLTVNMTILRVRANMLNVFVGHYSMYMVPTLDTLPFLKRIHNSSTP